MPTVPNSEAVILNILNHPCKVMDVSPLCHKVVYEPWTVIEGSSRTCKKISERFIYYLWTNECTPKHNQVKVIINPLCILLFAAGSSMSQLKSCDSSMVQDVEEMAAVGQSVVNMFRDSVGACVRDFRSKSCQLVSSDFYGI